MNARQRFINSAIGGDIDRFYRYELGAWESTYYNWIKAGKLPEDFRPTVNRMHDKLFEWFSFDDLFRLPLRTGDVNATFYPKFEVTVIEEGIDWKIISDYDGVTKKVFKPEAGKDSIPMFLEYPVKNREDWELIKRERLDISNVEKYLGDVEAVSILCPDERDFPVELVFCGAFGHMRALMGCEDLCLAFYEEPEMVEDVLDNWLAVNKQIASIICPKIQIDNLFLWEDMCYKHGPLMSPSQWRSFIMPRYCELIDHCKKLGTKSIMVDTDGDCHLLIPLFLEAGVNIMLPFEVQSGMDVIEVRKKYGYELAIMGGLDKRVLTQGRDAIKKEVDRVLPFFLESGKYIPTLDHNIPNNVDYDDFIYYLECLRSYE